MPGGGFTVTLHRDWNHQPWGLRLVGGCDLDKPLQVTRVAAGSPAERGLRAGDIVLQIADYDARDIRHQDALTLFNNAQNTIRLVVQREGHQGESSRRSSRGEINADPMGAIPRPPSVAENREPIAAPLFLNSALLDRVRFEQQQMQQMDSSVLKEQPYRTTPLVLPGAKVKKDLNQTECYLRHHPNPMFRQAPPHPLMTHEVAMKQKVADTVLQKVGEEVAPGKQIFNKQFNSPIGLYSEQNIVDQISQQAGTTIPMRVHNTAPSGWYAPSRPSPRKTVLFDPAKSETYKALQDQELGDSVHEVTPIMPKVFTPTKKTPPMNPRPAVPHPVPGPNSQNVNSIGSSSEEIQQSNTFKRLMHMVQGESAY